MMYSNAKLESHSMHTKYNQSKLGRTKYCLTVQLHAVPSSSSESVAELEFDLAKDVEKFELSSILSTTTTTATTATTVKTRTTTTTAYYHVHHADHVNTGR